MPDPSEIRRAVGLTQARLGALLGVSRRHVSAMEGGRRAVPKPVALVLEALGDGWRPSEMREAMRAGDPSPGAEPASRPDRSSTSKAG